MTPIPASPCPAWPGASLLSLPCLLPSGSTSPLRWGPARDVVSRALSRDFQSEEAACQVDVAVNRGCYTELLTYNDTRARLSLDVSAPPEALAPQIPLGSEAACSAQTPSGALFREGNPLNKRSASACSPEIATKVGVRTGRISLPPSNVLRPTKPRQGPWTHKVFTPGSK